VSEEQIQVQVKPSRPLVKCRHCDYTCHGRQALGRHVHFQHPDKCRRPRITIKPETLRDLMQLVDERLANSEYELVQGEVGEAVKEQDLKLHLALVAVAASKAQRAAQLEGILNRVVGALDEKLTPAVLEEMQPGTLVKYVAALNQGVAGDTEYLKGILELKAGRESGFFLRIIELLQQSAKGSKAVAGGSNSLFRLVEMGGGVTNGGSDLDKLISSIIENEHLSPTQLKPSE